MSVAKKTTPAARRPRNATPDKPVETKAATTAAPTTRRRPAAKIPAAPVGKTADALTSVAAPTILGANGEMIRHTQDYTVDLLAPGVEPERDFAKVLAKDPSETNLDFVAWVAEHVGYAADPKTVQILISTYHEFQASPEQKAKTIAKRLAAAQKRGEAAAAKAKKAAAAKASAATAAAK